MKRNPRLQPRRGDRLAKLKRLPKFSIVTSRIVLALERRWPHGTTVVYTRKHPAKACRCSLSAWRRWAKAAKPVLSTANRKHC